MTNGFTGFKSSNKKLRGSASPREIKNIHWTWPFFNYFFGTRLQDEPYSYTFYDDEVTIWWLESNTRFSFQFYQSIDDNTSYACSPVASVSAATTKACYNTPTIKSLSAVTKGVTVNWNTVYGKNSYIPAQKYTIQYRVSGTNQWKTATTSATGTSYTVKNLKSGTQYQFRICASKDNYFFNSLYSGVKTATAR